MTKKATRLLKNEKHEKFCQLFVFGLPGWDPAEEGEQEIPNIRKNATQCYIAAGYKARGASANVNASRLLRSAKIQARVIELREEETRLVSVYLRRWKAMLMDAQAVLEKAMRGGDVTPAAVTAAREVIEQAEGPSRFRFGIKDGASGDGGLSITLWSGRREDD